MGSFPNLEPGLSMESERNFAACDLPAVAATEELIRGVGIHTAALHEVQKDV